MPGESEFIPQTTPDKTASARALARVGSMVKAELASTLDVVRLTQLGVPPAAVDALIDTGLKASELDWVINRRTLSHRRQHRAKLTPEETGRWLRAAKLRALADEVLGDNEKAIRWLHKPRKSFGGENAITLMQTEAGAQLVEDTLNQIDAGYFA